MEYVFGTKEGSEILKTKGSSHSFLSGFVEIERKYPDQTITDNFRIVKKYHSDEDAEGNCYDWYEIDNHYRAVDKSGQLAKQSAEAIASMENTFCELDAHYDERVSSIENALCEIDENIEKWRKAQ